MESRRDVFQAIADPTRRAIIGLLALQPIHVNAIASHFDTSRQAVSLHLKILSECDLIESRQQGRERLYQLKPEKLREVHAWISQYTQLWQERFANLKTLLENETNLNPEKP